MKKVFLTLLVLSLTIGITRAGEGMWIPMLLQYNEKEMQEMGMRITAEDIYSINHSSLKDAIVLFGGGCTGEIVSDYGLLLTNHHCGYDYIQKHSSVEHDYLTNGFWAMNRSQELPCPGLTVIFLREMRDVTEIENLEKGGPIAAADYYALNNGTIEDLKSRMDEILKEIEF